MMHNTYTSEELNELVVKTFEKVASERNKSVEKIKHFIFDHGNERLLRRFWELIDEKQIRICGHTCAHTIGVR